MGDFLYKFRDVIFLFVFKMTLTLEFDTLPNLCPVWAVSTTEAPRLNLMIPTV